MKTFEVTMPITGIAYAEVEAETEEDAIEAAFGVITLESIQEWEVLRRVNSGNVCHAMQPWEAEARVISD